ncbi:MAG: helix-turn-helix domain-containing protein [Monoglobaceae bacterium]
MICSTAYVKCTPEHLSRQFYSNLKMNFRQYLNTLRIRFSRSLLKYTSESVSDIGCCSDFNSDAQFSKTFSNITDITPSKYRAEHANKENTD